MSAVNFLRQLLMKEAVKRSAGSTGIMTINKNIAADVDKLVQKYIQDAMKQGVDLETLSQEQLKMIVAMNRPQPPRIYSGDEAIEQLNKIFPEKGKVIDFPQNKTFKEQIEDMRKSGDIVDPANLKKNNNVLTRELFQNSNLNKAALNRDRAIKAKSRIEEKKEETIMDRINNANNRITQIKKEQDEMYRPKTDEEIKAKFEKQNKEAVERLKKKKRDSMPIRLIKNFDQELNEADLIAEGYSKDQANVLIQARKKMISGEETSPNESLLRVKEELADNAGVDVEDFTDIDFEIDVPDFAKGGRAGFYTGGITDVEPSLDDIGHGSDSLMARTRLMAPNSQATTSTGLNYLLAEDNDNMRVPFAGGGDPKRRAFLKLLATIGGATAAAKSGLLSLGTKGATKKGITETVKQSATSGKPPAYFFNLVNKIKTMGDDVTDRAATTEREVVTDFKDYRLTEDVGTGRQTIQKTKLDSNEQYYDETLAEQTYMDYIPGKSQADETTGKVVDEYIEDTSYLRTSGPQKGEVLDVVDGVPKDVIQEGTMFEDTMTEFGKTKKADGGRIGFSGGGIFRAIIAKSAAKKGMSATDFIKATNYKGLPPEIRMYISADEFAKLKSGQKEMYDNYIDMAKTRLEFQKNVEGGKTTPARELFEGMEKTMDEQSFVPKTVTSDDIAQMELMVKNRFNKGRKDNADGGIQTMLGE